MSVESGAGSGKIEGYPAGRWQRRPSCRSQTPQEKRMTEANPGDRELHLEYSDPFQSPTERLGSEDSMRRLFLVHFSCPLCGQEHSCEI